MSSTDSPWTPGEDTLFLQTRPSTTRGRALGEYVINWAREEGYHGIQFNAVVESNHPAVHLWQSLGFEIIGTVPEAFNHPDDGLVGLHVMYQRLR